MIEEYEVYSWSVTGEIITGKSLDWHGSVVEFQLSRECSLGSAGSIVILEQADLTLLTITQVNTSDTPPLHGRVIRRWHLIHRRPPDNLVEGYLLSMDEGRLRIELTKDIPAYNYGVGHVFSINADLVTFVEELP